MDSNDNSEYTSYKKVLLFGAQSTGKSSLANKLKGISFEENINHTENGN